MRGILFRKIRQSIQIFAFYVFFLTPQAMAGIQIPLIVKEKIDGNLSTWAALAWQAECLIPDSPRPPQNSHAKLYLGWNEIGLLFGVEVFDKTPSESYFASGAYEYDSVELFLAPEPTSKKYIQVVISPGKVPGYNPRIYFYDYREEELKHHPPRLEFVVVPSESGYTVEARFAWECLAIVPEEGTRLASRVFVNDHDGVGKRIRFSFVPPDAQFYPLHLCSSASPPQEFVAWASFDPVPASVTLNLLAPISWANQTLSLENTPLKFHSSEFNAWASIELSNDLEVPSQILLPGGTEILVHNQVRKAKETLWLNALFPQRTNYVQRAESEFANFGFSAHVFSGLKPPQPRFTNPEKVEKLLGGKPTVSLQWFDAEGNTIVEPTRPGLLGCLAEIQTPAGKKYRKRFILYRLEDGALTPPGGDDEYTAQILGFQLSGADATRSHANRISNAWWHNTLKKLLQKESTPGSVEASPVYPYGLRYPLNYDPQQKYPLLIYLHGSGYYTTTSEKQFFETFAQALEEFSGFVVYPRSAASWSAPAVLDLVDLLLSKYPIDSAQLAIAGFSMGGIGAWEVLLTAPEKFAAAAIIGGRGGSPTDAWRIKDIPILVINGTDDPTTTQAEAQIMVEAIRRAGGSKVETLWLDGAAHPDSMFRALANPEIYRWLESKIKNY